MGWLQNREVLQGNTSRLKTENDFNNNDIYKFLKQDRRVSGSDENIFIYRKTTTKISEVKSDSFSRSSLGFRLRRGFGLGLSWGGGRLSFRFVL